MTITFKMVPLGISTESPSTVHDLESTLEIIFLDSVQHRLRLALDRLDGVEMATLQLNFQF